MADTTQASAADRGGGVEAQQAQQVVARVAALDARIASLEGVFEKLKLKMR